MFIPHDLYRIGLFRIVALDKLRRMLPFPMATGNSSGIGGRLAIGIATVPPNILEGKSRPPRLPVDGRVGFSDVKGNKLGLATTVNNKRRRIAQSWSNNQVMDDYFTILWSKTRGSPQRPAASHLESERSQEDDRGSCGFAFPMRKNRQPPHNCSPHSLEPADLSGTSVCVYRMYVYEGP